MLAVVYLIFNEGYAASAGDALVREELCAEAIRLGRLLAELMPDEPEVLGLLALMLLVESRRAARTDAAGELVLLADQDRGALGPRADRRGPGARAPLPAPRPARALPAAGRDQRRARDAPDAAATDWRQILALYDQLLALAPTPVVALNRAVAVAELDGPQAGLDLVDALDLDGYRVFHAVRADLLRRLGRGAEAGRDYDAAIASSPDAAERDFLRSRRDGA